MKKEKIIEELNRYRDFLIKVPNADMGNVMYVFNTAIASVIGEELKYGNWLDSDAVLIIADAKENVMRLPAKECSVCHKPHIKGYGCNFCPNCGAYMRGDNK